MSESRGRGRVLQIAGVAGLLAAGVMLRLWTWHVTAPIRFYPDLTAAWHWGSVAQQVGLLHVYDAVRATSPDGNYLLDYVPLRLLVAEGWVWAASGFCLNRMNWGPGLEVNWPLLAFHTLMELAAALAAVRLVGWWLGTCRPVAGPRRLRYAPILAGAAIWLNPAMIINSFGRPGTDVWIVAIYLWAVYACARKGWFVAGCIIGAGALLKGQVLVVAPAFVLWALFDRRPKDAARWLAGMAAAVAVILLPWAVSGVIDGVGPGRALGWFDVGIRYGVSKYGHDLNIGNALGLAGLIEHATGWTTTERVLWLPGWLGGGVSLRAAMNALFAGLLTYSAFVMSRLYRARSPEFLCGVAAPWLVWFAVGPQMHERYLLYGAAAACLGIALNPVACAVAVVTSALTCLMTLAAMLDMPGRDGFLAGVFGSGFGGRFQSMAQAGYPALAWVVLGATAAMLWVSSRGMRGGA